jgi:class 3 adenylate cyclase
MGSLAAGAATSTALLPRGTVTFLLSDVEGSTALWERAPLAMSAALARHDALFDQAIAEHQGIHLRPRGEGDSRFAVFDHAVNAVSAALAIQRLFAAQAWPTARPIRVRIGIHTGHAEIREGGYYGTAVNRCARIRDLGKGGEILVSDATAAVVRDDLPRELVLQERGERRLRGLSRTEHLFQLLERAEQSRPTGAFDVGRWLAAWERIRWDPGRRRRRALVAGSAVVALMLAIVAVAWSPSADVTLLADDFDQPASRVLPEASDFPNDFAVGYGGGEYSIQTLSLNRDRLPSVVVPGWYSDAALSIHARLLGDTESQSVILGCRNAAPRSGYRLTLRPGQGTGSLDRADAAPVLVRLATFTDVASIRRRTAMNHLELRCAGDRISVTINGTLVASVRDPTYRVGRIWIAANVDTGTVAFGNAQFDNLLVKGVPAPMGAPEQHTTPVLPPANLRSDPD